MKKDKQFQDAIQDLKTLLNKRQTDLKNELKIEINIWDQDKLIHAIVTCPLEVLVNTWAVIWRRLRLIETTVEKSKFIEKNTLHIDMIPWEYFHFDLPELKKRHPLDVLLVCHEILFMMFSKRISHYLNKHSKSRDGLYINFGKLLEKDFMSIPYFYNALKHLGESARKKYKKVTGKEPYPVGKKKVQDEPIDTTTQEQKLYSLVYEKAISVFNNLSVEESLIKAAKGKAGLIPDNVKNMLIDEFRKYEKRKGLPWGNRNDLPESLQSIESVPDIPKLREVERTSELAKWIESLEDPKDREIARLKFTKDLSARAIAKKLSLSKSDVDRRIQKLKKHKPSF